MALTKVTNRMTEGAAVNVLDWGVVADGSTDNTAAYTAMISALDEGSIIIWPKGTYVGDFISSKAFELRGNGSTIIPSSDAGFFTIKFEGSLGSFSALSAAPAYGDTSLSGTSGLADDDLVVLYDGTQRPSDNAPTNYEIIQVTAAGGVYDRVYSDQDGGSHTYAKVTPLDGVRVSGFKFQMGSSAKHAVWVRYAKNVHIEDITMTGGSANTIAARFIHNITVDHVQRLDPSATGSGQGYNVAFNTCKYVKCRRIFGRGCRHDFDADSSYQVLVEGVTSIEAASSAVVLTHNSFGGFMTVKDIMVESTNGSYALNTSSQGVTTQTDALFRRLRIENFEYRTDVAYNAYDFDVAIYLQYPTDDVSISNVTLSSTSDPDDWDYAGGNYNTGLYIVRAYQPKNNFTVDGIQTEAATYAVFFDNNETNSGEQVNCKISNVDMYKFYAVFACNGNTTDSRGNYSLENIQVYDSSSEYGNAIFRWPLNNAPRVFNFRNSDLPFYTKLAHYNASTNTPRGFVDTWAWTRHNSTLNGVSAGGTITQYETLTRGDFAMWGSSAKTLSTTEPLERPIAQGNIFAIHNYGSNSLTIPANSDTVDNTSDIVIASGETHYFQPKNEKWTRYKYTSGTWSI